MPLRTFCRDMSYDPAKLQRSRWMTPRFELESGAYIQDFVQSYIVHGTPEPDGSNVILVTSSLGGDAHRLDFLIGSGLALDPAKLCVVATDPIGNGHSSSPSNSDSQSGMEFPQYSLRDMVEAQRRMLANDLGVTSFRAVIGASMGGMQALQWAVSHPAAMPSVIALVPLAKTPAWTRISNEISRRILMLDPSWAGGAYESQPKDGWRTALSMTQVLAARSPQYVSELCPEPKNPIAWLDALVDDAMERGFDANDWIYQTRAYDAHDVGTTPGFGGDTIAALTSIRAKTLVMGPPLDLLNPAEAQREIHAHVPNSTFVEIPSIRGHMAANVGADDEVALINRTVGTFLDGGGTT